MTILAPLNDADCLGKLSQLAADGALRPEMQRLAERFDDTRQLARFIRHLPQRNDDGNDSDAPKILCDVPQRARLVANDPNCFERSLLYLALAENIDAEPLRQLTTIDLPIGRHTFPVEDGLPVVLDPVVARNVMGAGLYHIRNVAGLETLDMRDPEQLLDWISDLAEGEARNQRDLERVARAREAFWDYIDTGDLCRNAIGDIGFVLALAERAAPMYGRNARSQVHVAAHALGRQGCSQRQGCCGDGAGAVHFDARNFSFSIGGFTISPNWKLIRKLGEKLGPIAVKVAAAQAGIPPQAVDVVGQAVAQTLADEKAEAADAKAEAA